MELAALEHPLFIHFSFFRVKFSVTDFWASMRARVFKFLIHLESGQVYCGTENQDAEIYIYHLFPFFLFSSLTPVKYIGKFVSKISQELLRQGF